MTTTYPGVTGDINSAMTMRSLYAPIRENPYEKRAKMLAPMMDQNQSGLAAPLLAYATGKEMAGAEEWDTQREEEGKAAQQSAMSMYQDKMNKDNETAIWDRIIKMGKIDAESANIILQKEVERNPAMAPFKDMEIQGINKDNWMQAKGSDGTVKMIYLPTFKEAGEAGIDSELWKKTVIPVLEGGKEDKPKQEFDTNYKTLTTNYFLKNKIDPDNATAEQKNAADMFARTEMGNEKARVALSGRAPKADKPVTSAMYNQATNLLVDQWLPVAENNAGKIPIDTLTGRPSAAAVRAALPKEQQGQFDRQQIDAQDFLEQGHSPANAVDKSKAKWAKQPATPAGKPAAGGAKPFNREDVIAEINRRKAGGQ